MWMVAATMVIAFLAFSPTSSEVSPFLHLAKSVVFNPVLFAFDFACAASWRST